MAKGKERKVIFQSKWLNVVEISVDGAMMSGLECKDNVVVLPYTLDDKGLVDKLGIMLECNPLREEVYINTLVTGDVDDDDASDLEAAKRELLEETGYKVQDKQLWTYLGKITTSKAVKCEHPCFAVDITGIEPEEKKGDGTVNEDLSKFFLLPIADALDTEDSYILAVYLKFFLFKYGKLFDISNED